MSPNSSSSDNAIDAGLIRHVFVEVHDPQGGYDGSPVGFGVLKLTDKFISALEQRAQQMQHAIMAPGDSMLGSGVRLAMLFSMPVRYGVWDAMPANDSSVQLWEISISHGESVISMLTADQKFMTTGIEISTLSSLGYAPENAYYTREKNEEGLAAAIASSLLCDNAPDPALVPLMRHVHAVLADCDDAIEPLEEIMFSTGPVVYPAG